MSLLSVERYSEPSQTSEMELFTKTVNGLKPLTVFAKKSILDIKFPTVHVSWKLFSGCFINAIMTAHASSIAEYGRVPISNYFTLRSSITQYASRN